MHTHMYSGLSVMSIPLSHNNNNIIIIIIITVIIITQRRGARPTVL